MKQKLRLDLDSINVQSFTTGGIGRSGTVKGNEDTEQASWNGSCNCSLALNAVDGCAGDGNTQIPCGGGATCSCGVQTCVATCYNSCNCVLDTVMQCVGNSQYSACLTCYSYGELSAPICCPPRSAAAGAC